LMPDFRLALLFCQLETRPPDLAANPSEKNIERGTSGLASCGRSSYSIFDIQGKDTN